MKMPNWVLLQQRGLRLLQGRKTYKDACDRQWIVSPAEVNFSPPAIYLEDDIHKVTDVQEDSTYEGEMGRLPGGNREHAATIAYQFQNAYILYGYAYRGAMKYPLVAAKETWCLNRTRARLGNAMVASTLFGSRYFGHWMSEDLTLALAAQHLEAEPVIAPQILFPHQADYYRLLDIQPISTPQLRCDQLVIFDDFGQNRYKRERYEHIRNRIKQLEPIHSNHSVMFLRKSSGIKRLLVNEMEVADFLKTQGFIILDHEQMTVTEIARQVLGAKIVLGVEGSQLLHGLYSMSDTGTIVALQPPYRFSTIHKDFTDCLGMRYGFLVGDRVPEGFSINLDNLTRLLEKVS
jgi:hypothetical protein